MTLSRETTHIKQVKSILSEMDASFRSLEQKGQFILKGWIVNKDNVGVAWIIFESGCYSHVRFHKSVYEFNCKELELRLENWELTMDVKYYKQEFFNTHQKLKDLEKEIKEKKERSIFSIFSFNLFKK
jgi:hypothetical protein